MSGGLPAAAQDKRRSGTRFGFTTYTWGRDWDIPTLIGNLTKAGVYGVELRTSSKYAHGVELDISPERRLEVKKQFAGSPVALVSIATGEQFDAPDPPKVKAAIENAKGFARLSHDVGSGGIRVFPNQFHKEVPREKTIAQIAAALSEVGKFAADYGQEIRLEAHGPAGDLATIRAIMDQVTQRSVRVHLNSIDRDAEGKGFEYNFNLVKPFLAHTLHLRRITGLESEKFPFQLQFDLLAKSGWDGWALLETSDKVEDRVKAIIEQRELVEGMIAKAKGA